MVTHIFLPFRTSYEYSVFTQYSCFFFFLDHEHALIMEIRLFDNPILIF